VSTPTAVLGAGSFGTCLAMVCARTNDVKIWSRREDVTETINREHRNPRYLTEYELPERIEATCDLRDALAGRELVIIAVPSQSFRAVMTEAGPYIEPGAIIVSAVKGIEYETGFTMHQVLEEVLDAEHHPRIVALSGPSFAAEIAQHKPTVVTLACREEAYAISVQATLSCPWFRCYTHDDIMGVETAGALKNVIAIAVGMSDGQDGGLNARAALMTRGLAEITRIGVAQGADPETFLGLAGMGDLLLTCTGDLSRNRRGSPDDPGRRPTGRAPGRRGPDLDAGSDGPRRREDTSRSRAYPHDAPAPQRAGLQHDPREPPGKQADKRPLMRPARGPRHGRRTRSQIISLRDAGETPWNR